MRELPWWNWAIVIACCSFGVYAVGYWLYLLARGVRHSAKAVHGAYVTTAADIRGGNIQKPLRSAWESLQMAGRVLFGLTFAAFLLVVCAAYPPLLLLAGIVLLFAMAANK